MEAGTWNYDGTKNGGVIIWNDGRKYVGEWKVCEGAPDLPDGMGTMTWPDGGTYVGEFSDGTMNGTGKMIYPNRNVEDGSWRQGQFRGATQ